MIATKSTVSLVVDGLVLRSGRRIIARDISFAAETDRVTWITGENGAGKSTLIRALAGRASVDGMVLWNPPPRRSDIAYYTPAMGVPNDTTVRDWMDLQQHLTAHNSIDDACDALLPTALPTAPLSRLSTGESKRLLLWSLLRPIRAYTFLDEPYEHLSPPAKAALTGLLAKRSRTGVVIVATNQEVPVEVSTHVIEVG